MVQLIMGYPDEDPPPRPRYPMEFTLFEDAYPELDDGMVSKAMSAMDDGYLARDHYRAQKARTSLEKGPRKETYMYGN